MPAVRSPARAPRPCRRHASASQRFSSQRSPRRGGPATSACEEGERGARRGPEKNAPTHHGRPWFSLEEGVSPGIRDSPSVSLPVRPAARPRRRRGSRPAHSTCAKSPQGALDRGQGAAGCTTLGEAITAFRLEPVYDSSLTKTRAFIERHKPPTSTVVTSPPAWAWRSIGSTSKDRSTPHSAGGPPVRNRRR